jgi:hypothetical protein
LVAAFLKLPVNLKTDHVEIKGKLIWGVGLLRCSKFLGNEQVVFLWPQGGYARNVSVGFLDIISKL